ncbi:MAG: cobalamin B12-binding domain-containing protein [Pseudomonadota bacterium]
MKGATDDATAEETGGGAENVLRAMLQSAVIPSLVRSARASAPLPSDHERDLLLRLVLRGERDGAIALMRQCVVSGMRAERLADDVITDVARALGEAWEEDTCDFVRVTFGSGLLAEVLRELRDLDPPRVPPTRRDGPRRSILLTPVPGEQHTLGVSVLADIFERAGWTVARAHPQDDAALMAQIAMESFDVVGLSIGATRALEDGDTLVSSIRRMSRNRDVRVIAGGAAFLRAPDRASALGADGIADDAAQAVELANSLTTRAAGCL